ncbi:MAG TPA: sensor histidine kinase [Bryobacteraceae bacterium]|nr:sensor histidine kinase [Bryobacteraceae bacterium]
MQPAISSPALADATVLLNRELARRVRKAARLLEPSYIALDASYRKLLARRGFDARQTKALAAITPAAAARLLGQRKPVADLVEQVEYSGRRLAKLDVEPAAVVDSLAAFDALLARSLRLLTLQQAAEVRWIAGQLNFCTIITLNNAFYQVREAETQTFFEIQDAELRAASGSDLIATYLRVLARYARADAACAVFPDSDGAPPASVLRRLGEPRMFHPTRGRPSRLLVDASWNGRYRSVWSIPLGEGVLQFGFTRDYEWLPRELRLLVSAAGRGKSVLEKMRLTAQLAESERQIRELAIRMLETEERERCRIRRELHDETAQLLPCLRLQLEMLERSTPESLTQVRKGLAEARELIGRTVTEIRRVLSDLSPAVLDQLGLAAAVRRLLSQLREMHGIEVCLDAAGLARLPKQIEIAAYRIAQECCTNVSRHSSARHLNVWLETADGRLKMRIEDDGVGFQVEEALRKTDSYGLAGIRERVALNGGHLRLSSRPGHGTRISVEMPVPEPNRPERARPRSPGKSTRQALSTS